MRQLCFFLFLFFCAPASAAEQAFSFSGSVNAGETYQASISPHLTLQLTPTDKGWQIEVIHTANTDVTPRNLAAVTLPLHGVNATQLEGWHFRNDTNTAPNDGSVNAPQGEREFEFVTRPADLDTVFEYYECVMSGYEDRRCMEPSLRWGKATLKINAYSLTPPDKNTQAAFKTLSFSVTGSIGKNNRIKL